MQIDRSYVRVGSISYSNNLAMVLSKKMDLWFVGLFLFLPGFDIITTVASFHKDGKC